MIVSCVSSQRPQQFLEFYHFIYLFILKSLMVCFARAETYSPQFKINIELAFSQQCLIWSE